MRENKDGTERDPQPWGELRDLLQALDAARDAGIINETEHVIVRHWCFNTERGLAVPLCCTPVLESAFELGKSIPTLRRCRARMETLGLIVNRTPANGHRGRGRGWANGLDLAPLLRRSAELRAAQAARRLGTAEFSRLLHEIRDVRGRISRALRRGLALSAAARAKWTALPRRIASQCLDELRAWVETCRSILASLDPHRSLMDDAPVMDHRQSTTTPPESLFSKNGSEKDEEGRRSPYNREAATMESVAKLLETAGRVDPDLEMMGAGYPTGNARNGLVEMAAHLAQSVGVEDRAIASARARTSLPDFVGLCLLLWFKAEGRELVAEDMRIREPSRWMWRMVGRCESGRADLRASLIGLRRHFESTVGERLA